MDLQRRARVFRACAALIGLALVALPTTTATADDAPDPCQLVTSAEASALTGATFADGVRDTTPGGSQICVYGFQTPNVFMVLAAQASDADTAQAAWAAELAEAQGLLQRNLPAGVSLNAVVDEGANVPGFDRAATAQGSATLFGGTISLSAIYLLKGATFVTFSDLVLGQPAPTTDALSTQAQTVLGRLP